MHVKRSVNKWIVHVERTVFNWYSAQVQWTRSPQLVLANRNALFLTFSLTTIVDTSSTWPDTLYLLN